MTIVTAMPKVKPAVIVPGMYLSSLPKRQKPITISRMPAMTVERISPSMPFAATMPATIVANAAVGPAIWTRLPPSSDTRNPATIAV